MAYKDLFVDQACDFNVTLNLSNPDGTALNVAGYTFSSNLKTSHFTDNVTDSLAVNIVDAPNGNISITWAAANSANTDAKLTYVYDVLGKAPSTNQTSKILWGLLRINPGVTQVTP